jgi:outer membrane cobalamin receptor
MINKRFIIFLFIITYCLFPAPPSFAYEAPVFYGSEVVVTAARHPRFVSEIPWSVAVISSEEVRASGATNATDVLRLVSGVDVKGTGGVGASTSIRLRGSNSNQVLVLVDGRRTSSPQGGWNDFLEVPVEEIERIEVVRGPVSALYGADAVGGVVNVITKKGKGKGIYVSATAGEFGTYRQSLAVGSGDDAFNYFLSAENFFSAGDRPNSDYDAQNFYTDIGLDLDGAGELGVSFGIREAKMGSPGPVSMASLTDRQHDRKGHVGLDYSAGELSIKARQDQFFRKFESATVSRHYNWSSGLELQHGLSLSSNSFVIYGADLRQDIISSTDNGDHTADNTALFLQDEIRLSKDSTLVLGVRGDNHSVYGGVLNPRVGYLFHLSRSTKLRASYGTSFRAPSFDDLYAPTTAWTAGNPNLKPERAQTVDLGLEQALNDSAQLSFGVYLSEVRDMIEWTETSPWFWQPLNVGGARISGGELEVSGRLNSFLYGFINYTYLFAMDTENNTELSYKPNNKCNVGLRYSNADVAANISAKLVGARLIAGGERLPPYTVVDLNLEVPPFFFLADNFLNEEYEETKGYPMLSRRYTMGVRFDL